MTLRHLSSFCLSIWWLFTQVYENLADEMAPCVVPAMNQVGFYVCLYVAMDKGKGWYQNRSQQFKLFANGRW